MALSAAFTMHVIGVAILVHATCAHEHKEVLPEFCKRYPTSDKMKVCAESVNKTVRRRGCDDLEVYTENRPQT